MGTLDWPNVIVSQQPSSLSFLIELLACWSGSKNCSPRVLPLLLQLIQLVVQSLQADAELGGGEGLVAGVFFQNAEDVLHLDLAQGPRGRGGAGRQADGRRVAGIGA